MFDQHIVQHPIYPATTHSNSLDMLNLFEYHKQEHYFSSFSQNVQFSYHTSSSTQKIQGSMQFGSKQDSFLCSSSSVPKSWNKQIQFNSQSYEQFSYLIWGKHQALKNITNFSQLFQSIKQKTHIQSINLCLDTKIPQKYKGAHFELIDKQQTKLYEATILLIQHLFQMQKLSKNSLEELSVMILVPRMLVPVVMGKQGKIISKIKSITQCDINVYGPFRGFNYQNIELTSKNIKQLAQTCYLIYNTVYKVLRKQSINISNKILTDQRNCAISLLIKHETYKQSICMYQKLTQSMKKQNNVRIQITKYHNQLGNLYDQNNQIIYKINGKMKAVKSAIATILNIIQFQSKLQQQQDLKFVINDNIAKSIKGLSGKILRDISSKSGYCFIEVKEKTQNLNKLIIKGNMYNKIKATYLTIQFICYLTQITIMESKKQLINYNEQINNFVDPFSFQNQDFNAKNEFGNLVKQKKIKKKKSKGQKGKNKTKNGIYGNINHGSNQRFINIIQNKENQAFLYRCPSVLY